MPFRQVLTLIFMGLGIVTPLAAEPASKNVMIDSGAIEGAISRDGKILSFKGIRYARPPVDNWRWRPPQSVKWTGVLAATEFGAECPQKKDDSDPRVLLEDCLFLNVWRPAQQGDPLPVMVWIHGGGYVIGGSSGISGTSGPITDGSALASQGLVVVTLNYRLGRLGFFAHPALIEAQEDPPGFSGNFGYMDQIKALEWVQANIGQFGGDPRRVTLVGESAGGASVLALLTSPATKGKELFQRAIVMSGGGRRALVGRPMANGTPQSADKIDEDFAKTLGIQGSDALPALRRLSADQLVGNLDVWAVIEEAKKDSPAFSGTAMIDGQIVSADPGDILRRGEAAPVPLLIGTTALELPLFYPPKPDPFAYFGAYADTARAIYFVLPDYNIAIDMTMNEPARFAATAMRAAGNQTWLYRFTYVAEKAWLRLGAIHGQDVPFLFRTLEQKHDGVPVAPRDKQMAQTFSAYLVNFAKALDPDFGGLAPWPTFDPSKSCLMDFSLDGPAAYVPDPRKGVALVERIANRQQGPDLIAGLTCW